MQNESEVTQVRAWQANQSHLLINCHRRRLPTRRSTMMVVVAASLDLRWSLEMEMMTHLKIMSFGINQQITAPGFLFQEGLSFARMRMRIACSIDRRFSCHLPSHNALVSFRSMVLSWQWHCKQLQSVHCRRDTTLILLHDITRCPKIPFCFVRGNILTSMRNHSHREITWVMPKKCLDQWESLFNRVVIGRVGREEDEFALVYEKQRFNDIRCMSSIRAQTASLLWMRQLSMTMTLRGPGYGFVRGICIKERSI